MATAATKAKVEKPVTSAPRAAKPNAEPKSKPEKVTKNEVEMWVCQCGAEVEASHQHYLKGWRLPKRKPTCPECVQKAKAGK